MMQFQAMAQSFTTPEEMAAAYLAHYFGKEKIEYPINPFQMLKDEGILFSLIDSKKLEGVYIPASSDNDIPVIGINANRPITRQRYTAAHELCHHFRDDDKQISCPIHGPKTGIEIFAEDFAAALLMPMQELRLQVNRYKNSHGEVSFDDVLSIADFFGVSFESCLYRIAYRIHVISGNIEPKELKKRIRSFAPDTVRKKHHMTYSKLYAGLIDCFQEQLAFTPTDHAKYVFQHNYIYNDSRMEGLQVTPEQAAEIVTDLRTNMQNSPYCTEENEAYLSIAGHYDMYQDMFSLPVQKSISVYETFRLNRKLFAYYPNPDFGGNTRQTNALVLGAKFETVDFHDIVTELINVENEIKRIYDQRCEIPMSEYIKHVARIHHRITVIHPFPEGNGRTSRAFMNIQFIRAGILPIYIKVEEKESYIKALSRADASGEYDELYEIIFRLILRSFIELNKK